MEKQEMEQSIQNIQKQQDEMMRIIIGLQRESKIGKKSETSENNANTSVAEGAVPYPMRTTLTSAKRVIEFPQASKAKKAARIIGEIPTPRVSYEAEKRAIYRSKIKDEYNLINKNLSVLEKQYHTYSQEFAELDYNEQVLEHDASKISVARDRAFTLKIELYQMPIWERELRRKKKAEIEKAEADIRIAEDYFRGKYHVSPEEAPFEIKRIEKRKNVLQLKLDENRSQVVNHLEEHDALRLEYHTQKLLDDTRPDREQIDKILAELRDTPLFVRDKLQYMQIDRSLDVITEDTFNKVIEKLYTEQSKRSKNQAKPKKQEIPKWKSKIKSKT
ncbi:MAG: hypothetical protein LBH79_01375 [Nitrososphaerota archaeon]|nr:hypothetical protein [Nitrososphaerota archaeon]